jgi:membrane protein implicated in regulation of membrane protease activity
LIQEDSMQQQASHGVGGLLAGGAVLAAMFLWSAAVSAHHGWGGYQDSTSDIVGTVASPVSMSGPHATMKVKVDGQVWDVVLAPPARAAQAGLKDGMIPVGEMVTVHGNRHRDPKKLEIKTSRLTWNGKVFAVYPDRN